MERLTPIDLDHANLPKRIGGGYDPGAVNLLLKKASLLLEQKIEENFELKRRIDRLQNEIERRKMEENVLRDAVTLAQRSADETRLAAQKHAHLLLEETRQKTVQERMDVQNELDNLKREIALLAEQRKRFTQDFRAMVERYYRELPPVESSP